MFTMLAKLFAKPYKELEQQAKLLRQETMDKLSAADDAVTVALDKTVPQGVVHPLRRQSDRRR